jgi:Flp pilus assembly protein TadB
MNRHELPRRTRAVAWAKSYGLPVLVGVAFGILAWALLAPLWLQLAAAVLAGLAWLAIELARDFGRCDALAQAWTRRGDAVALVREWVTGRER